MDFEKLIAKELGLNRIQQHELVTERLSSGSLSLDKILGGGYPIGRITELYGLEQYGKTTLALLATTNALRENDDNLVLYVDTEHHLEGDWVEKIFGEWSNRVYMYQPTSIEQSGDLIMAGMETRKFKLIVLDSIAGTPSKAEIEGEMSDQQVGVNARAWNKLWRKSKSIIKESGAAILAVNQERFKIGVTMGDPMTTPGGKGKDFESSIRIRMLKPEYFKDKDTGEIVKVDFRVKTTKNKTAAPQQEANIPMFVSGVYAVDICSEIARLGKEYGVFTKADGTPLGGGAPTWHFRGQPIGKSETDVRNWLANNEEERNNSLEIIKNLLVAIA